MEAFCLDLFFLLLSFRKRWERFCCELIFLEHLSVNLDSTIVFSFVKQVKSSPIFLSVVVVFLIFSIGARRDDSKHYDPSKGKSVAIDDVTCHQCVKLHAFEKSREIQFVPPDGAFELMNYRVTSNLKMPFTVSAIVNEIGGTRVDYRVRIQSNYGMDSEVLFSLSSKLIGPTIYGTKVVLKIPTPQNTAQQQVKVKYGKVKYDATGNSFNWIIKKFPGNFLLLSLMSHSFFKQGQMAFDLIASVTLIATLVKKTWSRPPISMEFEVPAMSSGLQVRFLKVVEPKLRYECTKWVRYISKAGQYQIRIN